MSKEQYLGKYVLQQCLGRGGMGEVWKALDSQLQRYVAIKLLRADWLDNPEFVQRFTREAQLLASLHHDHIIQIHDFNVTHTPDVPTIEAYMVMDYVPGPTLGHYIQQTAYQGNFPPAEEIIYIFSGISLAIDYAHRHHMIHRDIKPANILLDQRPPCEKPLGKPVLIDFGIARLHEAAAKTMTGLVVGTPRYSAPEQVLSKALPQSDLYSLGIILYEMTTGITPFRGETALGIFMQHLQDMPTPPMLINPQISPELSQVILKSIAKEPVDRFQSASEMTLAMCEAYHVKPPVSLLQAQQSTPNRASTIPELTVPEPTNKIIPATLPLQYAQPFAPSSPHDSTIVVRPAAPRYKHGRMLLAGLFIVTLLGSLLASFLLFVHNTPGTSGQVRFSSSTQTEIYDRVEIDLSNISDPQAGKAYYAWIESANYESAVPHWRLDIKQHTIHVVLGQPYPGDHNLLRPGWILVITEESGDPQVSSTNPDERLFYARLTTTSTLAFAILKCPGGTSQNVCLQ